MSGNYTFGGGVSIMLIDSIAASAGLTYVGQMIFHFYWFHYIPLILGFCFMYFFLYQRVKGFRYVMTSLASITFGLLIANLSGSTLKQDGEYFSWAFISLIAVFISLYFHYRGYDFFTSVSDAPRNWTKNQAAIITALATIVIFLFVLFTILMPRLIH